MLLLFILHGLCVSVNGPVTLIQNFSQSSKHSSYMPRIYVILEHGICYLDRISLLNRSLAGGRISSKRRKLIEGKKSIYRMQLNNWWNLKRIPMTWKNDTCNVRLKLSEQVIIRSDMYQLSKKKLLLPTCDKIHFVFGTMWGLLGYLKSWDG